MLCVKHCSFWLNGLYSYRARDSLSSSSSLNKQEKQKTQKTNKLKKKKGRGWACQFRDRFRCRNADKKGRRTKTI
jgi:hypothetical protein